jgi:hypothetical protein
LATGAGLETSIGSRRTRCPTATTAAAIPPTGPTTTTTAAGNCLDTAGEEQNGGGAAKASEAPGTGAVAITTATARATTSPG